MRVENWKKEEMKLVVIYIRAQCFQVRKQTVYRFSFLMLAILLFHMIINEQRTRSEGHSFFILFVSFSYITLQRLTREILINEMN